MRLVSDYMKDDMLRHELNILTDKTFGFDFENWYRNGYFEGEYIPYSFEENGSIISNVSANHMYFNIAGEKKYFIQIGTVMTDEAYRNQGLARQLIKAVIREYEGRCDGIYLFGNLSALNFYRKAGFVEKNQYQYSLKDKAVIAKKSGGMFIKTNAGTDPEMKKKYLAAVREGTANSAFEQENRFSLQMFYTTDMDNVYYSKELDCFAVYSVDDGVLTLQSVISNRKQQLRDVIGEIGDEYKKLVLGFTPDDDSKDLFDATKFDGGDDYRLFCLGSGMDVIERDRLFFPALSHA